ncbi:hypothetical protein ES703_47188 [subsurface metagenome]
MPIANYSTSVEALKTVGEIQGILVGHGARSILTNYAKDKTIESLSFIVETRHGEIPFRLPVNANAVLKVLEEQGCPPRYANYPQAVRIAWRIVKDWVRAQMALLETEMVRMEQVFLPYMVAKGNKTLFEAMEDKGFYLEEGKGE